MENLHKFVGAKKRFTLLRNFENPWWSRWNFMCRDIKQINKKNSPNQFSLFTAVTLQFRVQGRIFHLQTFSERVHNLWDIMPSSSLSRFFSLTCWLIQCLQHSALMEFFWDGKKHQIFLHLLRVLLHKQVRHFLRFYSRDKNRLSVSVFAFFKLLLLVPNFFHRRRWMMGRRKICKLKIQMRLADQVAGSVIILALAEEKKTD